MNKSTKLFVIAAVFATVLFASCKKEETANPVASFTISPNDTVFSDELLTLTNTSIDADTYLWNFGDGTTSTEQSPTKYYDVLEPTECEETFTITLTAKKGSKTSTATKNVVLEFCR